VRQKVRKNTKKRWFELCFFFLNIYFSKILKKLIKMIVSLNGGGAGTRSLVGGGWSIVIPNRIWRRSRDRDGTTRPYPTLLSCLTLHAIFCTCIIFIV
jgi:hypothetical protein